MWVFRISWGASISSSTTVEREQARGILILSSRPLLLRRNICKRKNYVVLPLEVKENLSENASACRIATFHKVKHQYFYADAKWLSTFMASIHTSKLIFVTNSTNDMCETISSMCMYFHDELKHKYCWQSLFRKCWNFTRCGLSCTVCIISPHSVQFYRKTQFVLPMIKYAML